MIATRHPMRFNQEGNFRILMVSDIQETLAYDKRALLGLHAMIRKEKPDLVILGGDNCDGRKVKTYEDLKAYLDIFTAPMEESHTPWMHVYGNHDYDVAVSGREQSKLYGSYSMNISGISPEDVPGACNYAVPILANGSDTVAFCIYAFDTHHKEPQLRPGVTCQDLMVPNRPEYARKWDIIRFEQQRWYWNLSKELEQQEGQLVPAMAVMHCAPHEVNLVKYNPDETGMTGESNELMQCGVLNSGVFATFLQRGDVQIIAAGHSHEVTLDGVYGGIRFCLDGCAGFSPYGLDDHRGGRIFDLHEDGTYTTRMVAVKDLMDISV